MGKTVLIVEDEQNIVDILSFNLAREGYDTIEAMDGLTGLQLALEQNPDLFEAQYNLASAMIETQRYDAAEKILSTLKHL